MNKRHRLKGLMAVMLIVVLLFSTGARAVSAEVTPIEVSTYEELVQAIAEAKNGDVIGIRGSITIPPRSTLGEDGKSVILRRMDFESQITLWYQLSSGYHNLVKNITFDGNKFASNWAYVTVYSDTIFSQVDFINCASTSDSGALNISNGEVRLNSCWFDENSGGEAGHIFNTSVNTVYIDSCTLKNGTCYKDGGAIYANRLDTTTKITNSRIYNNTADGRGGGIANIGALTVENSMLYNNTAKKGGADLYSTGLYQIEENMDTLAELYKSEKIKPLGWVSDGIEGVGTFLKLSYEAIVDEKPTEPVDPIDPPPTDPDPTEPTEPEPEDPKPTDPTPPVDEKPIDPEPPVEEKPTDPIPPEEKPTDPETPPKEEEPTTPDKPADPKPPKDESTDKEDPPAPPLEEKPNNTTNNSTTNNHSSTDRSKSEDNTRVTENSNNTSTSNNYYTTETTVQPETKGITAEPPVEGYTANNQSVATYASNDKETPVGVNTEATEHTASNRFSGNIKIDAKGVDLIFEVTDEGYDININANTVAEETETPAVVPASVPLAPEPEQDTSNPTNWLQVVMIVLLAGLLVLQFRKSKKNRL